jgi:hypothetical protein
MLPRFRVDVLAHAPEALKAFERTPYHALVVDERIGSPSHSVGFELAKAVRSRRVDAGIVLTADAVGSELRSEARGLGIDVLSREDLQGSPLRVAIEQAVAARSAEPPQSSAGPHHLPPALQLLVDDARDALAEGRLVQADQAYRLALVARAASSDPTGGGQVANECGRALGLARPTLLAYALLASRFSAAEFRELLAVRRNVHGEHLTVSHLQLLARLPRQARQVWTERAFSEGLSVRELRVVVSTQRVRSPK